MKDRIYTIPVTDAFREDCECPFCVLEKKLEEENLDYFLGGALMEPDCRQEMNEHGFCKNHLDSLFESKKNVLGLSLILSSYMKEYSQKLSKVSKVSKTAFDNTKSKSFFSRGKDVSPTAEMKRFLLENWADCVICNKLDKTMKRYISVFFHMWRTEKDFRDIFEGKKGFCNVHFLMLVQESENCLKEKEVAQFLPVLYDMQVKNLERLQSEVEWFAQKFDYNNQDAPWGDSKDAVPRCIEKLK